MLRLGYALRAAAASGDAAQEYLGDQGQRRPPDRHGKVEEIAVADFPGNVIESAGYHRLARQTEPVQDGRVILDFNFAYSPPCAFTEYVTCIFAPLQNHLPFRVEAGEIYR